MSDAHVHDQLGALVDGALGDDEAEMVRRHLAACDQCRGELESLESLDADVASDLAGLVTPAPELAERIVARHFGADAASDTAPATAPKAPLRAGSRILHVVTGLAAGLLLAVLLGDVIIDVVTAPFEKKNPFGKSQVEKSQVEESSSGNIVTAVAFRDDVKTPGAVMKKAEGITDAELGDGAIITTEPGVLYEIELGDGSRVRLNDESILIIDAERRLMLKRGEVWVEAQRDGVRRRDFEVKFPGGSVTTRAGTFTIAAHDAAASVFCIRGPVEVGGRELRGEESAQLGGKGIIKDEVYFPEMQLSWMVPLWKRSPGSDELRLYIRGVLGVLGESKAGFMAREIILDLGDDARDELLSFIDRNPLTRNPMNRRAAAELLPKVASGTKDRATILRLFDLLIDGDNEIAYFGALAVREATGLTPEKKHDIRFWRKADRKEREPEMLKWRKLWQARGQ